MHHLTRTSARAAGAVFQSLSACGAPARRTASRAGMDSDIPYLSDARSLTQAEKYPPGLSSVDRARIIRNTRVVPLRVLSGSSSRLSADGFQSDQTASDDTNKKKIQQQLHELRETINFHNKQYYQLDTPLISDVEYDKLKKQLLKLEFDFPELVTHDSPSQLVGSKPLNTFFPVRHETAMLSLNNAFSEKEILLFDYKIRKKLELSDPEYASYGHVNYLCQPKIDGMAVSLIYEKGVLTRAVTRGDGETGEDITNNAKTIPCIPLRLEGDGWPDRLDVRGEIYMTDADFSRLNQDMKQKNGKLFANPRNTVAGSMRQKDPALTASRPLKMKAFTIAPDPDGDRFETEMECVAQLDVWGFNTIDSSIDYLSIDNCIDEYCNPYKDGGYHGFGYQTDGVVIKLNCRDQQRLLGFTSTAPRWAMACKFNKHEAITRLESISIRLTRFGALTPVAHLEPVKLRGVTIRTAHLISQENIRRKDIREGDYLFIRLSGDVIPYIRGVDTARRSLSASPVIMPDNCPGCGTALIKSASTPIIRCPNRESCPPQIKDAIKHFLSRQALNVRGVGDSLIDKMVSSGMVANPGDFFDLREADLASLVRIGPKSAKKIIAARNAAKKTTLTQFIVALGIYGISREKAMALSRHFGSLDAIMQATEKSLREANCIGPKDSKRIRGYFQDEKHKQMIDALRRKGVVWEGKSFRCTLVP